MKNLSLFIFTALMFLILAPYSQIEASSATLRQQFPADSQPDWRRVITLYNFLGRYDSPLKDHAAVFVAEAQNYDLDWRLLVAISGVESTFAKQLPYNSYNAWGWGIYGNNTLRFSSYPEAISTISKSLRENYIDRWGAKNVYQIGRFYAASPTWAQRVSYFMEKIEPETLPLTL